MSVESAALPVADADTDDAVAMLEVSEVAPVADTILAPLNTSAVARVAAAVARALIAESISLNAVNSPDVPVAALLAEPARLRPVSSAALPVAEVETSATSWAACAPGTVRSAVPVPSLLIVAASGRLPVSVATPVAVVMLGTVVPYITVTSSNAICCAAAVETASSRPILSLSAR